MKQNKYILLYTMTASIKKNTEILETFVFWNQLLYSETRQ